MLEVSGKERFKALKSNFLLLYGCCQKIWLASVFCNLQICMFFSSSLAQWRSEPAVWKNVKNEGTVRLFSLTDELFRIISSKQRRKHVGCWWTCLLWGFFPSRKQGTGRSDSHRISMMDVSSARAGAFKSAPLQLGRIRPTPWTNIHSLCWWLLFSASFHMVGSSSLASPASSTAHTLAHFTSSICFSHSFVLFC